MYPSEEGQIKTLDQRARTVEIECGSISTADFSVPNLDDERIGRKGKISKIGKEKRDRTKDAYVKTKMTFGYSKEDAENKIANWNPYE